MFNWEDLNRENSEEYHRLNCHQQSFVNDDDDGLIVVRDKYWLKHRCHRKVSKDEEEETIIDDEENR